MKKLLFLFVLFLFGIQVSACYAQNKISDKELFAKAYVLTSEQKKIVEGIPYFGEERPVLYTIERGKDSTVVTFLQAIYFDAQWIHLSKGFTIIDKESGKEYPVLRFGDGIPLGCVFIVRGCNRKMIYVTLVFDALDRKTKFVDIVEKKVEDDPRPSDSAGIPFTYNNIKLSDYTPKAVKKQKLQDNIKSIYQ